MALYVKPGASGTGASANDPISFGNANCVGASSLWTPTNPLVVMQGSSGESFEINKTGTGGGALVQTIIRAGTTGSRTERLRMFGANASGEPLARGQYAEFKAVTGGGAYTASESMLSIGTDTASSAPISHVLVRAIKFNGNQVSYNAINNGSILNNSNVTAQQASAFFVWEDCWFEGARHNGCSMYGGLAGSENQASHIFIRCRFTNCGNTDATGRAVMARQSLPASWVFIDCEFSGNAGGPRTVGATQMPMVMKSCVSHNNLLDTPGCQFVNGCVQIDGCTFYGNRLGGIAVSAIDHELSDITNNIIAGNGGTTSVFGGIFDGTYETGVTIRSAYSNNCFHNNVYGASLTPSNASLSFMTEHRVNDVPGTGHVYADPGFASTISGSEDLRSLVQALRTGGIANLPGLGGNRSIGTPWCGRSYRPRTRGL